MSSHRAFWMSALLALVVFGAIVPDFGATWDEPQQRGKALRLLSYWAGKTPALHEPIDGAHLYGAPLDVIAASLEPILPLDRYVIRHGVIALVGWLGLVLCGWLANRLLGPPHGVAAMILLAASPFYMAHAINNPKDLPFATVTTAVLLALTRLSSRPPVLDWASVGILGGLIGLGLNVRPGALLFFAYVGIVLAYRLSQIARPSPGLIAREGLALGAVVVLALSTGWVGWPWAYGQPLRAPFRAMSELGHFGWGGTVLFAGRDWPGTHLPWDYVPMWFWLVTPPVVLVGLLLSSRLFKHPERRDAAIALWAASLFPIAYVMGTHATLYDGVRHLLFVVPTVTILAAAGWIHAAQSARSRATAALVIGLFSIGLLEPLWFQARNHPNQTAYVQPLAGGPANAFARYDLDYWGNCLVAALDGIRTNTTARPVYVTGWPMLILEADLSRFPGFALVEPTDPRAMYSVRLARGSRDELLDFARQPLITRVTTADGALLCGVSATAATPPGSTFQPRTP
jgi:hypothetical protein